MKLNFPALIFLCALLFISCKKDSTGIGEEDIDYSQITDISYKEHVQVLFNKQCVGCHQGQNAAAGLRMDSWENLIKGSNWGEAIIPYDSHNSLMIELLGKLAGGGHPVDQGKAELDNARIAFLSRWIDEGAKNDSGQVPYADSRNLLYVCSQEEAIVNIIDMDAQLVIRNIDLTGLGLPATCKPHYLTFRPDGSAWFVSLIDNQVNKVLKFNAANELVGEIVTDIPALLAHHPTENILYVSRFMDNNQLQSIFVMNSDNMTPFTDANITDGNIPLPLPVPHGIAMGLNGEYIYTPSLTDHTVMVINHATKDFVEAVSLGSIKTPLQLVVSPDGNSLYVSCIGSGEMAVIDIGDPSSPQLDRFIPITASAQPWHFAFTPDGSRLYVANFGNNSFSVIDIASDNVITFGAGDGSDGLANPHGVAISKDGAYVFISGRNTSRGYSPRYDLGDNRSVGTVSVVNTATNQIEKVLEVEDLATGIGMK